SSTQQTSDIVEVRPILATHGHESEMMPVALSAVMTSDEVEVAVDIRRSSDVPLKQLTSDLIRARAAGTNPSRIYPEPWLATRKA
ncbi:MAG: hypothetical protein M3319_09625, partial [Actinomycetota bacterium]|nr:hypothetical protein [Actinomycetota bacterium]